MPNLRKTPFLALGIFGLMACGSVPEATFNAPSVNPNVPGTATGGANGVGGMATSLGGAAPSTSTTGGVGAPSPGSGGRKNTAVGGMPGVGGMGAGTDTGGSESSTGGSLGESGGSASMGGTANGSGGVNGLGGTSTSTGGAKSSSGGASSSTGGARSSGGSGGTLGTGGAPAMMPNVRINEIRGNSPDFVELYNAGNAVANLSGYLLTDTNNGEPDLANPFVFPNGTLLQPGHYVVVLAVSDNVNSGPLPNAQCEDVGPGCYKATFAVNNAGEMIYLYNADHVLLDEVNFPPDVATTYGRHPNGTGNFSVTDGATPGAANP